VVSGSRFELPLKQCPRITGHSGSSDWGIASSSSLQDLGVHSGLLSENILMVEGQKWAQLDTPLAGDPAVCSVLFMPGEVGPKFHCLQGDFLALNLNSHTHTKSRTLPSLYIVTCPWDFFLSSYFNFFTFYLFCVGGGQKTTSGNSHLWVPGIRLKSLGLVAVPCTHWVTLPAPSFSGPQEESFASSFSILSGTVSACMCFSKVARKDGSGRGLKWKEGNRFPLRPSSCRRLCHRNRGKGAAWLEMYFKRLKQEHCRFQASLCYIVKHWKASNKQTNKQTTTKPKQYITSKTGHVGSCRPWQGKALQRVGAWTGRQQTESLSLSHLSAAVWEQIEGRKGKKKAQPTRTNRGKEGGLEPNNNNGGAYL
jgi:hypothetical protein